MKLKYLLYTIALLIIASALSACAGGATVASSWPGLTTDGETAYLAFNTQVYAFDTSNGTLKWRFPAEPNNKIVFYANPALNPDGQVLSAAYNNVLYSLNPGNGQLNWEFAEAGNRYVASPLATEKGIFAPSADSNLYALNPNGTLRWKFATEAEAWAQPTTDADCECIYLPSMDHRIYAFNADNGALLWKTEDLGGAIVGTPALSQAGVLYVGTFGSEILALDANNGRVLWRKPTNGWVWSGPALADGRLYFGDLDGYFYAINAADGANIWQLTPQQLDGPIVGTPLVIEENIYLGSKSGSLYAIDVAGGILWTHTVGGKIYTSPVAAGDLILAAPSEADRLLVAVSKQDGQERWAYTPEKK